MTEAIPNSLLIVIALAIFFGWRGYQRGVVRTLQRVVSLLAAYVSCYLFMGVLATALQEQLGWSMMQAYLVSSLGIFFGVGFFVGLLIGLIARAMENRGVEPAQIPGAVIGGLLGCFLGLIGVWLGGIMWDAFQLKQAKNGQFASSQLSSKTSKQDPVQAIAGKAIGMLVSGVLKESFDEGSVAPDLMAELVSNPVAMSQQMVQISQSLAMKNFFSDPQAQHLMKTNQIGRLRQNKHFKALMAEPNAAELLGALGKEQPGYQGMSQEEKTADLLASMYQRTTKIQTDPRFIQLAQTENFKKLSQNPSPLAMMSNPAFKEFSDIVFSEGTLKGKSAQGAFRPVDDLEWEAAEESDSAVVEDNNLDSFPSEKAEKVIYRWTDEKGKKHYGEDKPQGNYKVDVIRQ